MKNKCQIDLVDVECTIILFIKNAWSGSEKEIQGKRCGTQIS